MTRPPRSDRLQAAESERYRKAVRKKQRNQRWQKALNTNAPMGGEE